MRENSEPTAEIQAYLRDVVDLNATVELVCDTVAQSLAKSMMVLVEDIETSRTISSYGVDSLVAVDLRSWLFKELQAGVSVFDLLNDTPLMTLSRLIATRSKYVPLQVIEAGAAAR